MTSGLVVLSTLSGTCWPCVVSSLESYYSSLWPIFWLHCCYCCYSVVWATYVYWILILYWSYDLIFFPFSRLSLCLATGFLCCEVVFKFNWSLLFNFAFASFVLEKKSKKLAAVYIKDVCPYSVIGVLCFPVLNIQIFNPLWGYCCK